MEQVRTIAIKGLMIDDYVNYKKCNMFIGFTKCSFKCCIEAGCNICQNASLANSKTIDIELSYLIDRYKDSLSKAIVCGGLEPFDTFADLCALIQAFRDNGITDEFVIYTGYNENEIEYMVKYLKDSFTNIIIKFGRFIPNANPKFDDVLGITLASENQYAKRIC